MLRWPEVLGVGEYKRELQLHAESSSMAVMGHSSLPLPYSLLVSSQAFLGLLQQHLAARLCPHAAGEEVPCACSSRYADRAGEGSRYQTTAVAVL